jgi:hypothetical protein
VSYAVVYISIGNSDDKLTQSSWSAYVEDVDHVIRVAAEAPLGTVHGFWLSPSAGEWQNACWALQLPAATNAIYTLKHELAAIAVAFDQDSIAWAVAPDTEFIGAGRG